MAETNRRDDSRPDDDEMLKTDAAAAALGLSRRTLPVWRTKHKGPPFVRVGTAVRYRKGDLRLWMAANTVAAVES